MSNDISLSRVLGGLRIANPDDAISSPSREPSTERERTDDRGDATGSASYLAAPAAAGDADTASLSRQSTRLTIDSIQAERRQSETQLQGEGLSEDQSQSQPKQQSPSSSQPPIPSPNHDLQPQHAYSNPSSRPGSGLYTAAERDQAANSYNILRTDPTRTEQSSASRNSAYGMVHRSESRSNPSTRSNPVYSPNPASLSRETSHRDRTYNNNNNSIPTQQPPPPSRRSSKGRIAGGYSTIQGVPVVAEPRVGMVPGMPGTIGSEEWKDRGAAVGMQKTDRVDANGRPIMKSVKKGVRDFTFGCVLGEGSYSTVYFATDRQTLKEYAVKVLEKKHIIKEKKIKYVNIEKDTLNRLTEHPGIVRLYYTFQDEASLYYVLDLCSGGELLGVLKKTGTFDEECSRFFGAQILDAVEYMHSRGVIHRDLKPENVLLDDQLHVKITDFGTARLLPDPRAQQSSNRKDDNMTDPSSSSSHRDINSHHDRASSFVGTAEYVSPELLTSKSACKASDLWAFGCIIYQLLAGRPPFKAASEYLTFQKIVNLEYEFPPGFPPAARDLVERCLVLDPSSRLTIEHIKNHQFFDGQPFGKQLWRMKTPRLRPYLPPSHEPKIIQLNGSPAINPNNHNHTSSSNLNPNQQVPSSHDQPNNNNTHNNNNGAGRTNPGRLVTDIPPPSQLDIEWSPVLTRPNERILRLGDLMVLSAPIPNSPHAKNGGEPSSGGAGKLRHFFGGSTTKKRARLVMVTSAGRIVLAPAGGEEKKAKQDISLTAPDARWRVQRDAKGVVVWVVDVHGIHWTFEEARPANSLDPSRPTADEWLECLEQAKNMALSQSAMMGGAGNPGGYASDAGFADMSSSMSSPASTFVGNHTTQRSHLSKSQVSLGLDGGGGEGGVKEREKETKRHHRFSKRQSKQGLGPAF